MTLNSLPTGTHIHIPVNFDKLDDDGCLNWLPWLQTGGETAKAFFYAITELRLVIGYHTDRSPTHFPTGPRRPPVREQPDREANRLRQVQLVRVIRTCGHLIAETGESPDPFKRRPRETLVGHHTAVGGARYNSMLGMPLKLWFDTK